MQVKDADSGNFKAPSNDIFDADYAAPRVEELQQLGPMVAKVFGQEEKQRSGIGGMKRKVGKDRNKASLLAAGATLDTGTRVP